MKSMISLRLKRKMVMEAGMKIDIDRLRKDLKKECYGAYFVGGFGGALMESFDIDHASPEKLIEIARDKGIDLGRYDCDLRG